MTVIKIGLVRDMEYEQTKIVEAEGKEILLVRLGRTITAIGNECTHPGCRLSNGKIDGETTRCLCHGWLN
jgi:nitrite reductase/ring-hydroxylating ferredoxin subunit